MTLLDSSTPLTDVEISHQYSLDANNMIISNNDIPSGDEPNNNVNNNNIINYSSMNMMNNNINNNDNDSDEFSFGSTSSSVVSKKEAKESYYNGIEVVANGGGSRKSSKGDKKVRNRTETEEDVKINNDDEYDNMNDNQIESLIDKGLIEHNRNGSSVSNSVSIKESKESKRHSRKHRKSSKKSKKKKSKKRKSKKDKDKDKNSLQNELSIQSDLQESEKRETNKEEDSLVLDKQETLSPHMAHRNSNSNNSLNIAEPKTNDTSIVGNESDTPSNSNTNININTPIKQESIPSTTIPTKYTPTTTTGINAPTSTTAASSETATNTSQYFQFDDEKDEKTTEDNWMEHVDTIRQLQAADRAQDLQITDNDDDINPSDPINSIPDLPEDRVHFAPSVFENSNINNSNNNNGNGSVSNSQTPRNGLRQLSSRNHSRVGSVIDIDDMLGPNLSNSLSNSYSGTRDENDHGFDHGHSRMNSVSMSMTEDGRGMNEIMDASYFRTFNTMGTMSAWDFSNNNNSNENDEKRRNSDDILEKWESERKLIKNCWMDQMVHDSISDVGILKGRKQLLSRTSKEKFDLCKETHLHSYFGILWKKGESHNKWKQRYFDLDWSKNDFKIKYYSDNKKKSKKGEIDLKKAYMMSTKIEQKGNKKWTQITIWESNRQWQLATDNESHSGYWVGVIDNAMNKITQIVRNQLYQKKYIYINDKCIILQGWLRKSNPKGKDFKDRWWYLNTNLENNPKLRYYDKDMSSKVGPESTKVIKGFKGEIDIKQALHIGPCLEKNMYDKYPLCIDIVMKERTYHLVPNRLEQMELWLQTLHLFVPVDTKNSFGNIHSGKLQRQISTKHLAGPANSNWLQSYCVLTARSLYFFKSDESYHMYRRASLSGDKNKMKFSSNEGVFEFKPGMTFVELKGMYDNDHPNCFGLVLKLHNKKKNLQKVTIFQAKNKQDFAQWEQNFKAMGIEHKAMPAVGNNLFV